MWLTRLALGGALAAGLACSSSTSSGTCSSQCVTIQDFSFSPSSMTIKVGSTVTWSNNGPSSHTTTSDNGTWDSGTLSPPSGGGGYGGGSAGAIYQFTFHTAGTYTYHCKIHPPSTYPGFTGTITVTP